MSQVEMSQVEMSQVGMSQVEVSQVEVSQVEVSQGEVSQVEVSQVEVSHVEHEIKHPEHPPDCDAGPSFRPFWCTPFFLRLYFGFYNNKILITVRLTDHQDNCDDGPPRWL